MKILGPSPGLIDASLARGFEGGVGAECEGDVGGEGGLSAGSAGPAASQPAVLHPPGLPSLCAQIPQSPVCPYLDFYLTATKLLVLS